METSTPNGSDYEATMKADDKSYFIFSNGYSLLSNSHFTPFVIDKVRYRSVEQFMWASRALYFKDYLAHQAIMEEWSARKYKEIKIENFDFNKWRQRHSDLLEQALHAKFTQHQKSTEKLMSTGKSIIVYATKYDRVLGNGLELTDELNIKEDQWKGLNILGTILMLLRDRLADK